VTSAPLSAIVTDIEGTTTPIAFVRDTLFPYARARLAAFLEQHGQDAAIADALAQVRRLAPSRPPLESLLGWMDEDAKITPLKFLQGAIWREGYESGALQGALYDDVAPALRRWNAAGLGLFVYSSGSEEAQRLIFGHSVAGDLVPLFRGFFDTEIGGKREAASYEAIAGSIGQPPSALLFLSDIEAELDAAHAAGWRTCQLLRPQDGTVPSRRHGHAADFGAVPIG
jgi:enolase-phosphatase E1